MACKVNYLNSAGIHRREVKGTKALADAFPASWLIYASLKALAANSTPIDIDLLVVMEDRILLLELKDWHGTLKTKGDMWLHGRPQRSPVKLGDEKAKKVKSIISNQIPQLARCYVDSRIVLTGTTTRDLLPEDEKRFVLTLDEAKSLGDRKERDRLLGPVTMLPVKLNMLVKDFDKVLGNPSYFQPQQMAWDGYVVTDEDIFVHRNDIWHEHGAQLAKEERIKGLLRLFRFDKLDVGLNHPGNRRLIADRELKTIAYLSDQDSWMAERGILKAVGSPTDEFLTEHHQLLQLHPGWTTLRRYLERKRFELDGEQRADIIHTLASMLAELHDRDVAHRDLGSDAIWVGAPTNMALTGFFSARLPDDESVGDFLNELGTYADPEPDWNGQLPTAKERDVRSLGLIMRELASWANSIDDELPSGWMDVVERAIAPPAMRYNDARELADAIGELRTPSGPSVDQSRLDEFETDVIPYMSYLPIGTSYTGAHSTRFQSSDAAGKVVVKVWNGISRGNASRDQALLSLLDSAAALKSVPQAGIAQVVESGLSKVGPFVVTRWAEGVELAAFVPKDDADVLKVLHSLVGAVSGLHARGFSHGDLHPGNIIVGPDLSVTLIDLVDMPSLGGGHVRSMAWVPADHERRSDQEIDRFAICKIVTDFEKRTSVTNIDAVVAAAQTELARDFIATLDPLAEAIKLAEVRRTGPSLRSFDLRFPGLAPGVLNGVDDHLWVTAYKTPQGLDVFWITGVTLRVLLRMRGDQIDGMELSTANLLTLGRGQTVRMVLSLSSGPAAGGSELAEYLRELVPARDAIPEAQSASRERNNGEAEEGLAEDEPAAASSVATQTLDIGRVWLRSAELEEDSVLRVRIDRRIPDVLNHAVYEYASSQPIEFEDDDTVEVRLGGFTGRRIGFLDVQNCDSRRLAIRDFKYPIADGEFVALIDRRDRVSKERRRRAVERITRRLSAIPNLLDYFDPSKAARDERYEMPDPTEQALAYKLNGGQQAAFKALLEVGPVGLLQGPPGSGKTKFIASLVHWLLKDGGARRVLIASQSHEAVNNVLEELLKTYKDHGGYADLLRVGSRGATERVRPYQARSLRDRHRIRFENGVKTRIAAAAAAAGIPKQFVEDVVAVDMKLGTLKRSIEMARAAATGDASRDERRRSGLRIRALMKSFSLEAGKLLSRDIEQEPNQVAAVVQEAFRDVQSRHSKVPPGDLIVVQRLITLAHEWKDTLSSGHRNFDEFLAKTRRVVAGTCVGLGQSQIRLEQGTFDWVIVDEAARCTSGELAVPLQLGSRVVLVGDQRQLRPMVDVEVETGLKEEFQGFEQALQASDFERAFESSYGRRNAQVLDEQYRMVPVISDLVSETFYTPYGVRLRPSDNRKPDTAFFDLPSDLKAPVVWFDTAGTVGAVERDRNAGRDIWNDAEISGVISLLHRLSKETLLVERLAVRQEPAIGVICMYSEQKRRIEREWSQQGFPENFRKIVVIDTVDAYQGKENEIVIVTLVRSNSKGRPGHVGRENRCNVAMSRAKERLYIFGDSSMWSNPLCVSPMRTVLSRIKAMNVDDGGVRSTSEIKQ
jgi:serine/threonine protein kinase